MLCSIELATASVPKVPACRPFNLGRSRRRGLENRVSAAWRIRGDETPLLPTVRSVRDRVCDDAGRRDAGVVCMALMARGSLRAVEETVPEACAACVGTPGQLACL